MNLKSLFAGILLSGAVFLAIFFVYLGKSTGVATSERQKHLVQLNALTERATLLEAQLRSAEKERDRLKADAAEVHKLRGEISTLRKAKESLEKQAVQPTRTATVPKEPAATDAVPQLPANFANYTELAQFAGGLRTKAGSGTPLSAEERAWLEQMKPQLDRLESSPQDFAAFQSAMIQQVAGVSDPEKVEKIRQAVQKVYENAVNRGLTIENRPPGDPAWVEQRHQLDRRGTSAVHRILDDNERAAFDRSFLGIMGADLGTGVDKSLYPPGFIQTVEAPAGTVP